MQSALLDIIIIGCLVLLFAATYRKRTTAMVRFWTVGWVLILTHFTTLLFHPAHLFEQNLLSTITINSLIACGIAFLLAVRKPDDVREPRAILSILGGLFATFIVTLQIWGITTPWPYYLLLLASGAFWYPYALQLRRIPLSSRALLASATLINTAWLAWCIQHHRPDIGISAVLSAVYFAVGVLYLAIFRRLSGGSLTMVFGMLAWAAVFPASELANHLGILPHFSPEFWNIPKYFVAFGMILFLLEEEMVAASEASKHYQILFDSNPHPMWTYDRSTLAFQKVNDAALAQYGYTREQFLSMTLRDISVSGHAEDFAQRVRAYKRTPNQPIQHKKSDGSLCFVDVATHNIERNGQQLGFSLVQDVTERQILHDRLVHQANFDMLTGLSNRAWFEEQLNAAFTQPRRKGRQSALLCLDLDRFKQINDTYGHAVGDTCLQEVAKRLTATVRPTDALARVGGEEFAVLLTRIQDIADAEHIADQILRALAPPIRANGYWIELTASIGIAICPTDGLDATTLWRNADAAMYRAKRSGGNQFMGMSAEVSLLATEANELELAVRRGLREGGLEVHYQPLYTITGELHSLEALVRLRGVDGLLISPALFIPVAEERGLIVPLGAWVVDEVCRQVAEWQHRGLTCPNVAINISPLQITRPDFAAQFVEALTTHNLTPGLLGIEITETAMMRNVGEASRQIDILARLGVAFSVDDFGTGYSSFGQLDKLSVQRLKIDRSFIDRITAPDGTYSIVEAIILMAHSLGLEVVAEGVETRDQWDCLQRIHCDVIQGFFLSKPLKAATVPEVLQQGPHPHAQSVPRAAILPSQPTLPGLSAEAARIGVA